MQETVHQSDGPDMQEAARIIELIAFENPHFTPDECVLAFFAMVETADRQDEARAAGASDEEVAAIRNDFGDIAEEVLDQCRAEGVTLECRRFASIVVRDAGEIDCRSIERAERQKLTSAARKAVVTPRAPTARLPRRYAAAMASNDGESISGPWRGSHQAAHADNTAAALDWAGIGVGVFPCRNELDPRKPYPTPKKSPVFVKSWSGEASSNHKRIATWWGWKPSALIGLPCKPLNMVVIDADRHPGQPDGVAAFKNLIAQHGALPNSTPVIETQSRSLHYCFKEPAGVTLGNSRGRLPEGIDVRGVGTGPGGGYIIAPGSEWIAPDGEVRAWREVEGSPLLIDAIRDGTLPELPAWIVEYITTPERAPDDKPTRERLSERARPSSPTSNGDERNYLERALSYIPSDDRETWLKVGGALHDSGNAWARELWDSWSRTSPKFNAKDQSDTWKSFGRSYTGSRATVGTIIAEARLHGFDGRKYEGDDLDAEAIGKQFFDALEQSERRKEAEAAGADPETGELPPADEQKKTKSSNPRNNKPFDWTELKELPSGKIPVPPFDPCFLPGSLRDWAIDISERLQCPLDFVGVSMFVAMGSLIGRKVAVRPQRNTPWAEVPNIWGCIVGDPGVFKSPAMKEALAPINKLEAEAIDKNNEALEKFKREEHLFSLKVKAADRVAAKLKPDEITSDHLPGDPPEAPQLKRYVYGDTTYEALATGLLHNPNGVLAFRDELISLLKRLEDDRYANERGFYLSAWNGDGTYTLDRKISGHNAIKGACLSILGSTQPGRIADFVNASQGAGDDGLLQRFSLMVWPDLKQNWSDVDRPPNYEGRRTAFRTFERLAHIDPDEIGAEPCEFGGLPFLRFSDEARDEFLAWREPFEARVRGSELSSSIRSYLAKHRKLVPTIALISHLADGGRGPIQKEHLLRALAVAEYAEAHAMRCYSAGVISHVLAAQAIVRRIKRGDVVNGVTARDIHQNGWSHLTNRTVVGEALDLLVDHGWMAQRQENTGGRPTTKYYINPAVRR